MRIVQKLVRNGNSTQVTIPRPMLSVLGWLPGEGIVLTVLEDRSLHIQTLDKVVVLTTSRFGALPEPVEAVKP